MRLIFFLKQYRSLAAVLLRKQALVLSTLNQNTIETLKSNILQALQQTTDRTILRHLCFLTSAFAGQILSEGMKNQGNFKK